MTSSSVLKANVTDKADQTVESSPGVSADPATASVATSELSTKNVREELYSQNSSTASLFDQVAPQSQDQSTQVPGNPNTSANTDHHEVAHAHFLTQIAFAITKKEPYDNDPAVAEYIKSHPTLIAEAQVVAARIPSETKHLEDILNRSHSAQELRKFLDGLPPEDLAAVVKLSGESFLKELSGEERTRAAAVLADNSRITREFVELVAYKRFAEDLATQKAKLLSEEGSIDKAAVADLDARTDSLIRASQERFGNDAAITTHIRATAQRAQDFALAQLVVEEASTLARRAGAYEGLQSGKALTRRVDEYLEQHHDLLERNPDFEKVLKTRIAEERQRGRDIHRNLDFKANALHDEFHRFFGARDEKVSALLKDLNGEEMRFLRELYSEKFPDLHLREEITAQCSDTKTLLALYERQDQGFARRGLTTEQYSSLFHRANTVVVTEALCSSDGGARLAVELNDVMVTSPQPTIEIARRLQEDPQCAAEVATTKHADIFGNTVVEALAPKLHLISEAEAQARPPTSSEQRDGLGLLIVAQSAEGAPVAPELVAQFAVSDAQASAERIGVLRAQRAIDAAQIQTVESKQAATDQMLSGLYESAPELSAQVRNQAEAAGAQAQAKEVARIGGTMAYEVGLARNEDSPNALKERQAKLNSYLQSQREFQGEHAELARAISEHLYRSDARGVADYTSAKKAADAFATSLAWLGTEEDKAYQAASGKSPEVLALMRRLYREKNGESLDAAYQGDFSGAERDKVAALLINDAVAANAASFEVELGAFFSPNQQTLRDLARDAKTNEDRARFETLFSDRYARNHFERDAEGHPTGKTAKNLSEALQYTVSREDKEILLSLAGGKHDRGDALILKQQFHSTTFGNADTPELAKTLDAMRDPATGLLDTARIDRVMKEFRENNNGEAFHEKASKLSGADARWLLTMIPDGRDAATMEVESRTAKIQFGLEDGFFSGNGDVVKSALSAPAELRARADAEEREYGQISAETAQQLQVWQELNAKVASRYTALELTQRGLPATAADRHSLEAAINASLSGHNAKISKQLLHNSRLSVAEQLWDSMEGTGTNGNPAELIKGASKRGMAAIRTDFAKFSGSKESLDAWFDGDLSGHEVFDAKLSAKGRPETTEEMLLRAKERLDHEESGFFEITGLNKEMRKEYERLEKAARDGEAQTQLNAIYGNFVTQADGYRMTKDMVTDMVANGVSTTVIIVGSGVAIVASGGTATFIIIGVGAGVSRAGIKWAGKGDGYSQSEMAADGVQTVIDSAMPVALSKLLPAGTAAGRAILAQGGERLVLKGAVDVARGEGQELTRDLLVHYGQRHLGTRVLANTVDGTIISVAATPIQAGLMTAIDERTYQHGVGGAFSAFGHNTLHALPHAVSSGVIFSAAFGGLAKPQAIRASEPLSVKATGKALGKEVVWGEYGEFSRAVSFDKVPTVDSGLAISERYTPRAREYLRTQVEKNGVLTRTDLEVANLDNARIGKAKSAEFIKELRANGKVDEAVLKGLEAKVSKEGSLTQFDQQSLLGTLKQSRPIVTSKEIDAHLKALTKQVETLNKGLDAAQRQENLTSIQRHQEAVEIAQSRLKAVEALKARSEALKLEAPRLIAEAKANAAKAAQGKSGAAAPAAPSNSAKQSSAPKPAAEQRIHAGERSTMGSSTPDAQPSSARLDPEAVTVAAGNQSKTTTTETSVPSVKPSDEALISARREGDPHSSVTGSEPAAPAESGLAHATSNSSLGSEAATARTPSKAELEIQGKISKVATDIKVAEKWIEINAAEVKAGTISEAEAVIRTQDAHDALVTLRAREAELRQDLAQQQRTDELIESSRQSSRERAEEIQAANVELTAKQRAIYEEFLRNQGEIASQSQQRSAPSKEQVVENAKRMEASRQERERLARAAQELNANAGESGPKPQSSDSVSATPSGSNNGGSGSSGGSAGPSGGSTLNGGGGTKIVLEKRTVSSIERLKTADGRTVERVVQREELVPVEVAEKPRLSPELQKMLSEIPEAPQVHKEPAAAEGTVAQVVEDKARAEALAKLKADYESAGATLQSAKAKGNKGEIETAKQAYDLAQDALVDAMTGRTRPKALEQIEAGGPEHQTVVRSQQKQSKPQTKDDILAELRAEVDKAKADYARAEHYLGENDSDVSAAYQRVERAQDALTKAQNEIYAAELEAKLAQLEQQASKGSSANLEQQIAETREALKVHNESMQDLYRNIPPHQEPEVPTQDQTTGNKEDGSDPSFNSDDDGGRGGWSSGSDSGGGVATLEKPKTKTAVTQETETVLDEPARKVEVEKPAVEAKPETETKPVETKPTTEQPKTETPAETETPENTETQQSATPQTQTQPVPAKQQTAAPSRKPSTATQPATEAATETRTTQTTQAATQTQAATANRTAVGTQAALATSATTSTFAATHTSTATNIGTASATATQSKTELEEEEPGNRRRRRWPNDSGEEVLFEEEPHKKPDEPTHEELRRMLEEVRRLAETHWGRKYYLVKAHGALTKAEEDEAGFLGYVERIQGN